MVFPGLSVIVTVTFSLSTFAIRNSLFIISEAETPSLGIDGLTPVGLQRAEVCIPALFGNSGIGLVLSCTPDRETGACQAAFSTVSPLAKSLNLTVNTSCDTGDNAQDDCVSDLIAAFAHNSTKAIVAVWDSGDQDTFLENLDIDLPDDDDDDGFHHDVIITIRNEIFIGKSSQNCLGIDGRAPGSGIFDFKPAIRKRSYRRKNKQ